MTPEQIAAARELINQVLTGNHRPTPAQWAYKLSAALDALAAANERERELRAAIEAKCRGCIGGIANDNPLRATWCDACVFYPYRKEAS